MIDPSLVKLLNIKGSPSKLSLTTVNNADTEEEGLRVEFQIVSKDQRICKKAHKGGSSNSQQNHMVPASPPSKQSKQARQGESSV